MRIAYIFDLTYPYSKAGVERRICELAKRVYREFFENHVKNGEVGKKW